MSDYPSAVNFVLHLEDETMSGKVTVDSDGRTRFGLLDKFHPELVTAGFYSLPTGLALAIADTTYKTDYWNAMNLDLVISNVVAAQLLSISVNDGVPEASKMAQRAAGLPEVEIDGKIGPVSVAAINAIDEETFLTSFDQAASNYYHRVVSNEPAKIGDLQGWLNRIAAISGYQG